jgi:hypothetical protein
MVAWAWKLEIFVQQLDSIDKEEKKVSTPERARKPSSHPAINFAIGKPLSL